MVDQIGRVFTLIIVGGVAIRIVTNPRSAKTLSSVFNGIANDIHASFGN